ncbi:hypothetical protein [Pseudoalteromonas rubra]|uniref:hypothetical protein n=1 Tax=Pseudoalteromonas rubra TaxID=43658 RepID=UPI000F77B798|nr:hypothetical protein [Pseudoalteromonas rubra]
MRIDLTFQPYEDQVAYEYFNSLNTDLGFKALTIFMTLSMGSILNPEIAQLFAYVAFFAIGALAVINGKKYRSVLHMFLPKHKGFWPSLFLSSRITLFVIPMVLLWFLAIGEIDLIAIKNSIAL